MSVVSVNEIDTERNSERRQTKPTPPEYEYRATRIYQVLMSDLTDTPIMAEQASDIPALGTVYPGDDTRRVQSVVARPSGVNRLLYIVTVDYSSRATDGANAVENPLAQPAEVTWSSEQGSEPRYQDGTGTAITNSAGESFDPTPQFEVADPVLTVAWNVSGIDPAQLVQYMNTVNSDDFFGPPGQARIVDFTASKAFQNNVIYWRKSIKVVFRENYSNGNSGWTRNILDEGFNENIPATASSAGGLRPIKFNGENVSKPAMLDGSGRKLAVGASPIFRFVQPFKTLPFAALNLPV